MARLAANFTFLMSDRPVTLFYEIARVQGSTDGIPRVKFVLSDANKSTVLPLGKRKESRVCTAIVERPRL